MIEKINFDYDMVAQAEKLTDKVNQIIDVLNNQTMGEEVENECHICHKSLYEEGLGICSAVHNLSRPVPETIKEYIKQEFSTPQNSEWIDRYNAFMNMTSRECTILDFISKEKEKSYNEGYQEGSIVNGMTDNTLDALQKGVRTQTLTEVMGKIRKMNIENHNINSSVYELNLGYNQALSDIKSLLEEMK